MREQRARPHGCAPCDTKLRWKRQRHCETQEIAMGGIRPIHEVVSVYVGCVCRLWLRAEAACRAWLLACLRGVWAAHGHPYTRPVTGLAGFTYSLSRACFRSDCGSSPLRAKTDPLDGAANQLASAPDDHFLFIICVLLLTHCPFFSRVSLWLCVQHRQL